MVGTSSLFVRSSLQMIVGHLVVLAAAYDCYCCAYSVVTIMAVGSGVRYVVVGVAAFIHGEATCLIRMGSSSILL